MEIAIIVRQKGLRSEEAYLHGDMLTNWKTLYGRYGSEIRSYLG